MVEKEDAYLNEARCIQNAKKMFTESLLKKESEIWKVSRDRFQSKQEAEIFKQDSTQKDMQLEELRCSIREKDTLLEKLKRSNGTADLSGHIIVTISV